MNKGITASLATVACLLGQLVATPAVGAAPAAQGAPVEPELLREAGNLTAAQQYPDAGIEHVRDDRRVVVNADGTSVEVHRSVVKILNKRGQEGWSEGSEGYDTTSQSLRLDWARTITIDHRVVPVAANAIKEAAPFSDYPSYDHYRVKTWSYPATAPGAIVDYQTTIRTRRPMLDHDFADHNAFDDFLPARRVTYMVSVPRSLALHAYERLVPQGSGWTYRTTPVGNRLEYCWERVGIGYTLTEPEMPPPADLLPSVWLTSIGHWQAVGDWWHRMNDARLEPDDRIRALSARLTQGLDTPEARAKAIYQWVVRNIRYVYVDMTYSGYESPGAREVLDHGYGDCKGGSSLLAALLRAAGIPAWHALLRTNDHGAVVKESPSLHQFNHCIVAAQLPQGLTFLDNVGKTVPFGTLPGMDQGTEALVIGPGPVRFEPVPVAPAGDNTVETRRTIQLDADGGATISVQQDFHGLSDSSARGYYQSLSPTKVEEAFQARAAEEVQGGQLLDFGITDPEDLGTPQATHYRYHATELAMRAGDLLILRMPGFAPTLQGFERTSRRFPLWNETFAQARQEVTIQLPKGYRVRYLPPSLELDDPAVAFSGRFRLAGDTVHFEAVTTEKARTVTPEAYTGLRDLMRKRALFGKELVVLERGR